MKCNPHPLSLALAVFSASAIAAAAASFLEDFNSGTLNPSLTVSSSPGFSFGAVGGRGEVAKQAGTGNGELYVTTSFAAMGDFTVTVRAGRTDLGSVSPAALGLMVQMPEGFSAGYADVFFNGSGQIYGNLWVPPAISQGGTSLSASAARFQIRRVGNALFLEYDAGSGLRVLTSATNANLAVPLKVSLFLIEQYGLTVARSGWFDDLNVTATRFFYPTQNFTGTNQPAAFLVSWQSVVNNNYQLEYRSEVATGGWSPDGPAMAGTGSRMSVTNWVAGQPHRYYRVGRMEVPPPTIHPIFLATLAPAADLVSWPSVEDNHYQVEYRSALTGGQWTPLGPLVPGTGSTMSITNWFVDQPQPTYRVLEVP